MGRHQNSPPVGSAARITTKAVEGLDGTADGLFADRLEDTELDELARFPVEARADGASGVVAASMGASNVSKGAPGRGMVVASTLAALTGLMRRGKNRIGVGNGIRRSLRGKGLLGRSTGDPVRSSSAVCWQAG